MGEKCRLAMQRCKDTFGARPETIGQEIEKHQPGAAATSCYATMFVLGSLAAPASPITPSGIKTPSDAMARLPELLRGDDLIYVNLTPDHHFILFPLSDREVGILQGFQSDPEAAGHTGYSVYEWIQSGKDVMPVSAFLDWMKLLLTGDKVRRQSAAQALFSVSGSEDYVADWYEHSAAITSIETSPPRD